MTGRQEDIIVELLQKILTQLELKNKSNRIQTIKSLFNFNKKQMSKELKQRIKEFNDIKYPNDNETRIVFATLKPKGTVTTAPKDKE